MGNTKNTRILLINPPITTDSEAFEGNIPSLGIAYIAAVLEKKGFKVEILDAILEADEEINWQGGKARLGLSDGEMAKRIRDYKPGLIGIAAIYTAFIKDVKNTIAIARKNAPKTAICCGGTHASVVPESVLGRGLADLVTVGESELTMLEIAEKVENGKSLKNIRGTVWAEEGKIRKGKKRPMITNLDNLPFPARHLLPLEKYLNNKKVYPFAKKKPVLEIISSRGCPGKCVFCSVHSVWGRTWRPRTAKNVVDEMEFLSKEYGIKEFSFLDDNVSANPKRLLEICDEIINRKMDIAWETPNGIALWTLNEKILGKMKESGYYRIKFGIESGCPETLKYIGKPINLEKTMKIIEICNRLGIWTSSSFIIGFPEEDMKSIRETIDFAKESGLDFARFLVAQPLPHTKLKEDFRGLGLLEKGMFENSSAFDSKYNTLHLSSEELNRLRKNAEREFQRKKIVDYSSPAGFLKYLWPKLSSPGGLSYFAKSGAKAAYAKITGKFL